MRQENNNIFSNLDWITIFLYAFLVLFGWMNIYSASYEGVNTDILSFSTKHGKQLILIALSTPIILLILFLNSKFIQQFSSIFYLASLISLIGLFVFGKNINGARSWYSLGPLGTLQPSEFAKAFTALALAKLMSDRKYNLKLIKNQAKAFVIIFLPAFFITLQPDPGSALIYLSFFFVLNREGLSLAYISLGSLAIILFILTLYFGSKIMLISALIIITFPFIYGLYKKENFLRFNGVKFLFIYVFTCIYIIGVGFTYNSVFEQRHRDRFDILLGKKIDHKNIGYNSYQSELTISSGGFWGKGYLKGDRTQGDFVPEQETDYIFSTIGEEWGFFGSSLVIIIFICLIYRILYLAETQTNKFSRIYGYGIASIFFFHMVVNIGMVIGLLPTVGIPLPFFSYGGSSLWGFTLLLFIFIRLDAHKHYDW